MTKHLGQFEHELVLDQTEVSNFFYTYTVYFFEKVEFKLFKNYFAVLAKNLVMS